MISYGTTWRLGRIRSLLPVQDQILVCTSIIWINCGEYKFPWNRSFQFPIQSKIDPDSGNTIERYVFYDTYKYGI